jgi:hypothetical protein
MKDLFKGVRYDVIEPKAGDIVRINMHKERGVRSYGSRDYLIIIYPSKENIHHLENGTISFDCIRYLGYIGWMSAGCISTSRNAKKIVYVKPSINDIREFSQKLLKRGERYNRKKKEIIKVNKNESNR